MTAVAHRFVDVDGIRTFYRFGLRLALSAPERVAALVIQNGDVYEDEHGPEYAPLKAHRAAPVAERRRRLGEAVTQEGFRDEFVGEVPDATAERVSPDTWTLAWAQLGDPAELHLLDGGHWLLETHGAEVAALCREFLARVHGAGPRRLDPR